MIQFRHLFFHGYRILKVRLGSDIVRPILSYTCGLKVKSKVRLVLFNEQVGTKIGQDLRQPCRTDRQYASREFGEP